MMRSAAGLAAVAGLAVLVASFRPSATAATTILQDAQAAVEKTRTVRFEMSTFEAGKAQNRAPARIRVLAPGRVRIDEPGGNFTVSDLKTGKSLRVEPGAKRARFTARQDAPGEAGLADPYEFFRHIDRKKVGDLPPQTIGKVEAVGFEVVANPFGGEKAAGQVIRVWVHPETKLPLRVVYEPKSSGHSYGRAPVTTVVCENFVFDEALAPDLFSMEPPKGYDITR